MSFIEYSQLNLINTYKPCQDLKTIKKGFTDKVKNILGDLWFRVTENTKQALKKFCLLGNKRGLVFVDPKNLAKEFGVSLVTLNTYLKKLVQSNVIIKLYRRSSKHNGKGAPVYLFTNHPYFPMWANMLGITIERSEVNLSGVVVSTDFGPDLIPDLIPENTETPTDSKAEETFFGPNSLELKENYNNYNKLNDSLNINDKESKKDTSKKSSFTKFIKYVPKVLQHFGVFFGDTTKNMYDRICKAAKKLDIIDKESIRLVAFRIMDQLKTNIKNGRSYTGDELCAYSYKTTMIHFTNDDNKDTQVNIHDNQVTTVTEDNDVNQDTTIQGDNNVNQDGSAKGDSIDEYIFDYTTHDNQVNQVPKKCFKREEMVPEWLKSNDNTVTPKKASDVSEERKKAIWAQVNSLPAGSM